MWKERNDSRMVGHSAFIWRNQLIAFRGAWCGYHSGVWAFVACRCIPGVFWGITYLQEWLWCPWSATSLFPKASSSRMEMIEHRVQNNRNLRFFKSCRCSRLCFCNDSCLLSAFLAACRFLGRFAWLSLLILRLLCSFSVLSSHSLIYLPRRRILTWCLVVSISPARPPGGHP